MLVFIVICCTLSYRFWKVFGPRLLILYFFFAVIVLVNRTVRECFLYAFKDLIMEVLSSGVDGEWQKRRRFHSEDALDSLRLKNSGAGYLSRIINLYRETEELLNDAKNVNEVSEKLLDIDQAFARFEKAHYDYIGTLSGNLEEWENEARYFKEHCNRKINFESRIRQWIHSIKVPVVTHENVDTP